MKSVTAAVAAVAVVAAVALDDGRPVRDTLRTFGRNRIR